MRISYGIKDTMKLHLFLSEKTRSYIHNYNYEVEIFKMFFFCFFFLLHITNMQADLLLILFL